MNSKDALSNKRKRGVKSVQMSMNERQIDAKSTMGRDASCVLYPS